MDIEPISYPVPSHGATTLIGNPETACLTASCMKTIPIVFSPFAAALIGAEPDFVYWLMFLCRPLMNSKPSSSPNIWTIVARVV